jgi:hypothetical protein
MSQNGMWDYFTKTDSHTNKAQCKKCKKLLSLGSEKPRFQTVSDCQLPEGAPWYVFQEVHERRSRACREKKK